ncbi:MAG: cytochrome b/b6 domain-containing protein [Gammaproteobacteria bacterium]
MKQKKPVWDPAVRLFHWLLVLLFIAAWATAEQGPAWMDRHMQVGYAIMTLVLFRLLWGIYGSEHARFSNFIAGPGKVLRYIRQMIGGNLEQSVGHNPLGGWSVVVMLLLIAVQSGTGLFANDDIYNEGPLTGWVTNATSGLLTKIHKINFNLLLAIIAIHIVAVLGYLLLKKENLIKPMFTGTKYLDERQPASHHRPWWLALLTLLVCAAGVGWLVS